MKIRDLLQNTSVMAAYLEHEKAMDIMFENAYIHAFLLEIAVETNIFKIMGDKPKSLFLRL